MNRFRVRAAFAVACFFLVTFPAFADLSCSQIAAWGSRGLPVSFAARDTLVFAADGRGVTVYDVSRPASISEAGFVPTRGVSRSVALVDGSRIAVATSRSLELFQAGGDGSLQPIVRRDGDFSVVASRGSLLATGGAELELWRLDGSSLVPLAQRGANHRIEAIAFSGDTLVASESSGGIRLYDVTAGRLDEAGYLTGRAFDLLVHDGILYAASGATGIDVFDIRDLRSARFLTRLFLPDADVRRLAIAGSRLAAADRGDTVHLFDLTDPARPQLLHSTRIPAGVIAESGGRLAIHGTKLDQYGLPFATGEPLRLFDVLADGSLRQAGEFLDRSGPLTGVGFSGDYAFVADPPVLRVLDVRGILPREVARVEYGDASDRIHIENGYALVHGHGEVHLIDVRDPLQPFRAGVYHTQGVPRSDVAFSGAMLLEANRASGFHLLDITDPAHPRQTTGLKNDGNGQWQGVSALGETAWGWANFAIKVVDLRDRSKAKIAKVIAAGGVRDMEVMQRPGASPLLVAMDARTLRIFDLAEPLDPVEIGTLPTIEGIDIAIDGSDAFIISAGGELVRIDLRNPRAPRVSAELNGFFAPTQVAASNGLVAVADTYSVRFLRVDVPAALDAPLLTLTPGRAGRLVHAEWTSVPNASSYEVETSNGPDFATAERSFSVTTTAWVDVADGSYVRVRAKAGCLAGAWSEAKQVTPEASLAFEEGSRRIVVRDGADARIVVGIRNHGASARQVTFSKSSGGAAPPPVNLSANGRSDVEVVFAAAEIAQHESLTLTATSGDAVATLPVTVTRVVPSRRAPTELPALSLPGAGATRGANGTNWKSDLSILCREESCDHRIGYSVLGTAESESVVPLTLTSGEFIVIEDAVRTLFGTDESAGIIHIYTSFPSAVAASLYTYNDTPEGRYGQRIPAVRRGAERSTLREILGIAENASFRTNLGFVNQSDEAQTFLVELLAPSGGVVASRHLTIAPFSAAPLFVRDLVGSAIDAATARITGGTAVAAYASRIDQRTGDATFTYASSLPEDGAINEPPRLYTLGVAGSTPGAGGSEWRTALHLKNATSGATKLRMTFFPATSAARSATTEVELAPNELLASEDVVASHFALLPASDSAYGSVRIESATPLLGWARLYNTTSSGTYGQNVPLRESSPARAGAVSATRIVRQEPMRRAQIFQVAQNDAVRTNLTLVETAGKWAAVRLNVYAADGELLAIDDRFLQPWAAAPLLGFPEQIGLRGPAPLRIEVELLGGEGRVDVYASRVDQRTNDAVTIVAE